MQCTHCGRGRDAAGRKETWGAMPWKRCTPSSRNQPQAAMLSECTGLKTSLHDQLRSACRNLHHPKSGAAIHLGISASLLIRRAPIGDLVGCSARLTLLLLEEALGVQGADWRSNAGKNRQRDECRYDGLHGSSSS